MNDRTKIQQYIDASFEKLEYIDVLKTLIQFSGFYDAKKIIHIINRLLINQSSDKYLALYRSAAYVYLFRTQKNCCAE